MKAEGEKKEAKDIEMQRTVNRFASLLTLVLLTLTFGSAVAANKTVFYHTDALGSVVAATDEQGELLWRESYKPFGDRLDRQVSTQPTTRHSSRANRTTVR